jgi:hypothetical protein
VAGEVLGLLALDAEAALAEGDELEEHGVAVGLAEDDVGGAGGGAVDRGLGRADEDVGDAVAVDVADAADGGAGDVAGLLADDLEAGVGVGELAEEGGLAERAAEDDVDAAGVVCGGRGRRPGGRRSRRC